MVFVELLGFFTAVATSEFEVFAAFFFGPSFVGIPNGGADTFATNLSVGDEIFKVGVFADARAHGDADARDAEDFAVFFGDE